MKLIVIVMILIGLPVFALSSAESIQRLLDAYATLQEALQFYIK